MSSVSGSATNLIGMVEYTQPEDERWVTNVTGMVEYAQPLNEIWITNFVGMVEYAEPEATGIATRKMLLGVGR